MNFEQNIRNEIQEKLKSNIITVSLHEHIATFRVTFTKKKDEKVVIIQIEQITN